MCVSCGCNQPENDWGDPRNITGTQLRAAATEATKTQGKPVSVHQVVRNIKAWLRTQPRSS